MTVRIIRPHVVELDLVAIANFVGQTDPDVGLQFFDAAEDAFKRLAAMPAMGGRFESTIPRLAEVRVWPIRGFEKQLIYYRALPDGIEVVRVLHGSRDIERIFRQEET